MIPAPDLANRVWFSPKVHHIRRCSQSSGTMELWTSTNGDTTSKSNAGDALKLLNSVSSAVLILLLPIRWRRSTVGGTIVFSWTTIFDSDGNLDSWLSGLWQDICQNICELPRLRSLSTTEVQGQHYRIIPHWAPWPTPSSHSTFSLRSSSSDFTIFWANTFDYRQLNNHQFQRSFHRFGTRLLTCR